MEDKNEDFEFKEEIIIDQPVIRSQPRKLNSKIIGKKTVLRKSGLKSSPPLTKKYQKKTNAEFLIEKIIKTYWTTKWKEQINIMKFSKIGYNKNRANFRHLCMKLDHSLKYHQYLYLIKLFDNMEKNPLKPGVKHDEFYGKIKLLSKNINRIDIKEGSNKEKIMIKGEKTDDNIEIKVDIPKILEVESNPKTKSEIENKINYNKIMEGKMETENDFKQEKKNIKIKHINNNDIIKIKDDNNDNLNNNLKYEINITNNNNDKHFIEILKEAIKRVSEQNILLDNKNDKNINKEIIINQEKKEEKINYIQTSPQIMEIKIENEEISNISQEKKAEKIIEEGGEEKGTEPKIKIKYKKTYLKNKIKKLKEKIDENEK